MDNTGAIDAPVNDEGALGAAAANAAAPVCC